jgi:DHA1 family multidrug resistance protein-like MFS transporter
MEINRKKISILFFTLVVIMLGFGMVIPILPFYIEHFGASGTSLGLLMALYAIMQFLFAPLWGSISDQIGRKPVLLIGVLGNLISQLIFGLSTSLWMLFVARTLAGILSSATLPTSMAYISDITSDEDRSHGMGIIGAAMGVGMVLGPGIAGWLATRSLAIPFFLAAFLSFIALILIYLYLPESLAGLERPRGKIVFKNQQFKVMWQALFSPIGILLVLAFLLSFGLTNFEGIFGLYALDRYNYGTLQVGGLLTFMGVISALVQGVLIGPLTKRLGEARVLLIAVFGCVIGYILMLFAESLPMILLTTGFFIVNNALLRPVVSSMTSKQSTIGQGVAMGLNNSFMSLGRSVGPLWAGFVFDINTSLPYISGAIILVVGFFVTLFKIGTPAIQKLEESKDITYTQLS